MFEQTPTQGQDGWLNHVIILKHKCYINMLTP